LVRFAEAENALRSAHRGDPTLSDALYTLGLLAELKKTGDERTWFRKAREVAPERYPSRPPLSQRAFEDLVEEALSGLSETLRGALEAVQVLFTEVPEPDDLLRCHPPVPPTSLGMFIGFPPAPDGEELPAILLFKRNIERAFSGREALIAGLRMTVQHEVGYALGLD